MKKNTTKNYTISNKRTGNIVNLDLNRNIYNAGYITNYSLSVLGFRCLEVDIKRINNFRKESAMII